MSWKKEFMNTGDDLVVRTEKKEKIYRQYLVDNVNYDLEIFIRKEYVNNAVPVLVPTYMPNQLATRLTQACVASIKRYTSIPTEVWLIDNGSPKIQLEQFLLDAEINTVLNKTEPIAPRFRNFTAKVNHWLRRGIRGHALQSQDGSYANAVGLELGVRVIPQDVKYVVTLHSDTLVLDANWLPFFLSKITDKTRISAFRRDPGRVNAAHIGGLLFDYQLYKELNANFFHNLRQERYPDRPEYDVGDYLSIRFEQAGYDFFVAENTFNTPDLPIKTQKRPILQDMPCDRCINDQGEIFFAHLGRGATKAFGTYSKGLGPEEWVEIANSLGISA
jgi:hypothetical protein